ncbi:MAG: hypothetical protein ACPH5V_03360, partial [Alcanivorax sp.]
MFAAARAAAVALPEAGNFVLGAAGAFLEAAFFAEVLGAGLGWGLLAAAFAGAFGAAAFLVAAFLGVVALG